MAPPDPETFPDPVDWPAPAELPRGRQPADRHRPPLEHPDDRRWLGADDRRRTQP